MSGLPSPTWPLVDDDKRLTKPWYGYLNSADETWRVRVTDVATTANTLLSNDGVSLVLPTTHTLEMPVPGCRKIIIIASASTTGRIALPSTTARFLPGTGWALTFGSAAANKLIELVGVTTSQYYIVSNPGSATVTT